MPRELKANRYLIQEPKYQKLANFIIRDLPYLSFNDTIDFYVFVKENYRSSAIALLGCNDRFFFLTALLHRMDACHPWLFERCREVEEEVDGCIDLWARFHYKDLCKLTKVLTTTGWKCHGDLKPGDFVFSPSGAPVRVIATKHFTDSACYRVGFDTGAEIICGAGHLWKVDVSSSKRVPGTWKGTEAGSKRVGRESRIVETSELAAIRSTYRPVIKVTQALEFPTQDLPVDPYVLGAWLGDGSSSSGIICGQDDAVFLEVARRGYVLSHNHCPRKAPFRMSTVYGLSKQLRALGLNGNKHIPEIYLRSSIEQRLELLRGLIDTDGHVSSINGCVTFAQKKKEIAESVRFLANSLGFKARLTPVRTTDSWHVTFQVNDEDPDPCLIPRKLKAIRKSRLPKIRGWKIKSVDPTEVVETNCIQVDSEDGMYLCGEDLIPTHNSSIITFAGITQEIIIDPELTVAIFSHTKDIARAFLEQIKTELQTNEDLKTLYGDVLYQTPEREAQKWSKDDGIIIKRTSNPKEATVEAWGLVDGQPVSRHYGLMVFDDVVTEKSVTNPEMIKKTTISWENADNLAKSEGSRKWVAGTRWSFGDSYGIMLDRKALKPRIHPATHNGKANGTPVFLTAQRWEEIKRWQKSTLSAQMLLNPAAGTEAMFHAEWFAPYDIIPSMMNVYIMCDPSKGRTVTSDRSAIAVIGVDVGGNKYLLDGVRHRMRLRERYDYLKRFYNYWSTYPGVQCCTVGYEQYGMQADLEVIEEYQERDRSFFKVEELSYPRQGPHSKTARVERLEPDMSHGRWKIPLIVYHPDVALASVAKSGGARHEYDGICAWTVWQQEHADQAEADGKTVPYHVGQILYRPLRGPTKMQRFCEASGQLHRIVRPLRRRDESNEIYDLTRCFMEEARFFPFAPHDDLIDVISRVFDMDVQLPVKYETSMTDGLGDDGLPYAPDDAGVMELYDA